MPELMPTPCWESSLPWVKKYNDLMKPDKVVVVAQFEDFIRNDALVEAFNMHLAWNREKKPSVSIEYIIVKFQNAVAELVERVCKPVQQYDALIQEFNDKLQSAQDQEERKKIYLEADTSLQQFAETSKDEYIAAKLLKAQNPKFKATEKNGQVVPEITKKRTLLNRTKIVEDLVRTQHDYLNQYSVLLKEEQTVLQDKNNELKMQEEGLHAKHLENQSVIKKLQSGDGQEEGIIIIQKTIAKKIGDLKRALSNTSPGKDGPPPPPPLITSSGLLSSKKTVPELSPSKRSTLEVTIDALQAAQKKLKNTTPRLPTKSLSEPIVNNQNQNIRETLAILVKQQSSNSLPRVPSAKGVKKQQVSRESIQGKESELWNLALKLHRNEQVIFELERRNEIDAQRIAHLSAQRESLKAQRQQVETLQTKINSSKTLETPPEITPVDPVRAAIHNPPPLPPPLPPVSLSPVQGALKKTILQKTQGITRPKGNSGGTNDTPPYMDMMKELARVQRRRSNEVMSHNDSDEDWESDSDESGSAQTLVRQQQEEKLAQQRAEEEKKRKILQTYREKIEKRSPQSGDPTLAVETETFKRTLADHEPESTIAQFKEEIEKLSRAITSGETTKTVLENPQKAPESQQYHSVPVPNNTDPIEKILMSLHPDVDAREFCLSPLSQSENLLRDALKKADTQQKRTPGIVSDLLVLYRYVVSKTQEIEAQRGSQRTKTQYISELHTFYQHATTILLSDSSPDAQHQQLKNAAQQDLKLRNKGIRLFADILMVIASLAVVGLAIGLARLCTGHSFFFSNAETARANGVNKMLKPIPDKEGLFQQALISASA
ncbi:MAG: hypothetical protein JJT82_09680 [Legionellaceae bacterium]|nr:hypothetical protein [Legionellaceae bacterium]